MSTNDNSDKAKSKIEQIRLDLEKKLAALERAKQQTTNSNSDEISSSNEIIENETKDVAKTNEETTDSTTKSFVEQISNIEKSSVIQNQDAIEEDTLFEISDEIEDVEEEVKAVAIEEEIKEEKEVVVVPPIPPTKEDIDFNKIESNEPDQKGEIVGVSYEPLEEEPKKSKLNFLIYGLLAILLLVVGYYAMDYMKGKNNLDSEKTKKILSEYENRRYQDSIRLLDAEKRLSEFQDSIANADRIELTTNASNTSAKQDKSESKWSRDNTKPTKPATSKWSRDNAANTTTAKTTTSTPSDNDNSNNNTATNTETPTEVAKTDKNTEKEKDKVPEKVAKKVETLTTIEKAPIYPGCAGAGSEIAKKRCMITKINKFVKKNFNSYVAEDLGLKSGTQKINVKFIIDKNGYVNVSRVRASHPALKKEAIRVVNKLPKMIPGKSKGKAQNVNYFLPIVFNIDS